VETTLRQIIEACRQGDQTAQTELVRRFYPWAMGLARATADDKSLAADVVQEAFVHALEGLERLENPNAFPGYLRQIVRRCAFRENRQSRGASTAKVPNQASPLPTQFDEAVRGETAELVREAVRTLPTKTQKTVELFYLAEMPCRDISSHLGVPIGTVKRRLHEGRKRLRYRLLGLLGPEERPEDLR
jgi:RNA polymerase sigma factor (sigma-70 family)